MLSFSKVWAFFFFFPFSDVFPDICGRLKGESSVKAPPGGTFCGFCEQLPVSTVLTPSGYRRGLQPIITEGRSLMGWKCSMGYLQMHNSVVFRLGVHILRISRVCTGQVGQNSLVRCDVITYLIASANIDIAPGPLGTNV